ncbi:hypothetical protein ACIBF1_36370 [Spirillospora sp. NPDC050679]
MADSPSGVPGPAGPARQTEGAQPPPPPPAPWGPSPPWWAADSDDAPAPAAPPEPVTAPGPAEASGPQPMVGARPLPDAPATVMDFEAPAGAAPAIAVQSLPTWEGTGPLPAVPGGAVPAAVTAPNATGAPAPDRPGPPGPPGPQGLPGAAPAAAQRRAVPKIGLVIGGVFAALMVVGAVVLTAGGEEPPPRITAVPATAGLHRDAGVPAASAAYPFVAAGVRAGGVQGAKQVVALYSDAPAGMRSVLFMGGTGPVGDPAAFLARSRPSTFIAADAGGTGGEAGGKSGGKSDKAAGKTSCGTFAVLADVHAYCAWATEHSYGVVASNTPLLAPQPGTLADLTRRMRADLEKRS